jgi:hypothetical protein
MVVEAGECGWSLAEIHVEEISGEFYCFLS